MNSNLTVKELKGLPNDTPQEFESVLIYKKGSSKTARNGSEFLMVELCDKTGSFAVTCFSDTPEFNFFKATPEGTPVSVAGKSDYYQGRFSPKIFQTAVIEGDLLANGSMDSLVEVADENPDDLWSELESYVNEVEDEALRATVNSVFEEIGDVFKSAPAAISMHHAYRYGLLEHTVHVTRAGRALFEFYPEVNKDLALAGMILHDTGKTIEYEGDFSFKKSRTGVLNGHVVLGYRLVRKAAMQNKLSADYTERLEHIVLSHQGELEWGAAVMAGTPEAVFVSMVDNLDAKMGMVTQALKQTPENEQFSEFKPGLKSPVLTDPVLLS